MRDEIQKRPVLLPHRCNRHRILLHCIREIEAVLPNSKEETVSIYKKSGLGHSTTKRTFSVPPASCAPFFGGMQETIPTFDSLERFSVPIGEVNMISITAVKYILYNVNCT